MIVMAYENDKKEFNIPDVFSIVRTSLCNLYSFCGGLTLLLSISSASMTYRMCVSYTCYLPSAGAEIYSLCWKAGW
jgi:hypothetical protein